MLSVGKAWQWRQASETWRTQGVVGHRALVGRVVEALDLEDGGCRKRPPE